MCRVKANRWEAAHKLASSYMSEGEVRVLYMEQAQKMEGGGSLLEAEKLYLQVGEVKRIMSVHHQLKKKTVSYRARSLLKQLLHYHYHFFFKDTHHLKKRKKLHTVTRACSVSLVCRDGEKRLEDVGSFWGWVRGGRESRFQNTFMATFHLESKSSD